MTGSFLSILIGMRCTSLLVWWAMTPGLVWLTKFADEAYASVKGYVRTYVLHQQLLEHLSAPPAPVLDVGGGAGHQSFPLAEVGYDVTLLDPSPAMLDKGSTATPAAAC